MPSPKSKGHLDGKSKDDLGGKAYPLDTKSFLDSSKFSDLTIKIDGRDFDVHKIIVCSQSEYFDRLFGGQWKETINNVVSLKEDNPDAIKAMIHFMYGSDYEGSGHGRMSSVRFSVKVYGVADKYGVATLKQLAKDKFDDATRTCWDTNDFSHAITDVYGGSQYHELQKIVVQVSYEKLQQLLEKDGFLRVLKETSSFAADLVLLMAAKHATCHTYDQYRCPSCSRTWEARLNLSGNTSYHCPQCDRYDSD